MASRVPWLMNLRNRVPALRRASARRWLGLSAQRSLPRWRARHLRRGPRRRSALASRDATRSPRPKAVVLFVDTFNGNFETENAVAAVRVLQAAGYAVHVARRAAGGALCCGRTLLAAGMAERAKAQGARAARRAAAVRRARHRHRRPRAVVPADAARRDAGDGPRRRRRDGRPARRCCSRSSSPAKRAPAASRSALRAGDSGRCWCTATATRRRSARCPRCSMCCA